QQTSAACTGTFGFRRWLHERGGVPRNALVVGYLTGAGVQMLISRKDMKASLAVIETVNGCKPWPRLIEGAKSAPFVRPGKVLAQLGLFGPIERVYTVAFLGKIADDRTDAGPIGFIGESGVFK